MRVISASSPRGHRLRPKQERINFRGARRPSTREIDEACAQVRRSGVVPVLAARLRRRRDAAARLSVFGYEVALTLHGYTKGHRMVLVEIVRLINSFGPHTLHLLRMPDWHYDGCYDRFQRLHSAASAALDEGWEHVDIETGEITRVDRKWYRLRTLRAAVDLDLVRGCGLAVDGTDMETWNHLHGDVEAVDPDGEPDRNEDDE